MDSFEFEPRGFTEYSDDELFSLGLNGYRIVEMRSELPIRTDLLQDSDLEKLNQTNPEIVDAILQYDLDFLIFKYEGSYPLQELMVKVGHSAAWLYLFMYFEIPSDIKAKLIPIYNQKGIIPKIRSFFLENTTEEAWKRLEKENITPKLFRAKTKRPVWVEKKPK